MVCSRKCKEASVTRADEWRAKQEEGDSVWVIMEVNKWLSLNLLMGHTWHETERKIKENPNVCSIKNWQNERTVICGDRQLDD